MSEPTIELGENRYLTHYIYEVYSDDSFVGHIFMTRYNYLKASEDQVMYRWMCQKDSYIEHNKDCLLESSAATARLPIPLVESIEQHTGVLAVLDEVTFSPRYRGQGLEASAISDLMQDWSGQSDAVIVPDFAPMARHIAGISVDPVQFWSSSGFHVGPMGLMMNRPGYRSNNVELM